MIRIISMVLFAVALACLGTSAAASPTLFHDPAALGIDPGSNVPQLPAGGGTEILILYLHPGDVETDNGGTPCNDGAGGPGGNGDEACGFHFEIAVTGDVAIVGGFSSEEGMA